MNKVNKICITIIVICAILVGGFCTYLVINHKSNVKSDAIKFKEEYESFNNQERNGKKIMELNIDEENPMVYKTGQEIIEILKNEKAIVYFGFGSCPWCRNLINPLIEVAKEKGVEKVYYVDILNIRDSYEYAGSIVPNKTKDGSKSYYEILDFFGDNLDKFYVQDEKGNKYDTGVTRLYAPTVVAVDNGEVKAMHVGTVESQKDPYVPLTEKERKELKDKLYKLFEKIYNLEVCTSDSAC